MGIYKSRDAPSSREITLNKLKDELHFLSMMPAEFRIFSKARIERIEEFMKIVQNWKSILALLLAFALVISLSPAAFAAQDGGVPPEPPDGQMGDPSGGGGQVSGAQPDGQGGGQTPGDPPDGMPGGGQTPDGQGDGQAPGDPPDGAPGGDGQFPGNPPDGAPGGMPGGTGGVDSYDAVTEYASDTAISNQSFTSTGTDENAILISGGTVTLDDITVSRISSDSTGGDNSSFYGVGAAVLATDGTVRITSSTIATDSAGGAGVFAYGDGVVYVSDSVITTEKNTSGGIHAAGGGTLYASDLKITTQGESSAAIRSDRGGGLMVVSGGDYTSNGTGSPAVYCTANIAIQDADLMANRSEAVCIEGLNSLYLYGCDLTGSMLDDTRQNDCTWTVIVYQSMSGDSQIGCGTYQMVGGSLTSKNGGLFYTTNTESSILLKNVNISAAADSEFFLRCTGNNNARGWGSVGRNGADCTFTAIDQEMSGDVVWDSVSELDFYMTDGSSLTGAFLNDESCAGAGGSGYANLYISADSTWVVTGDSVLTGLYKAGTVVDASGNTVTVQDASGTVYVQGNSAYTVTVSSYAASVNLSGAASVTAWEDVRGNSGFAASDVSSGVPETAPSESVPSNIDFTDVAVGAYYYDAVRWAEENGIAEGTGNMMFSPDNLCTRAEIITFLWRAEGKPEPEGGINPFADIAENAYYYKAVLWAYEQGMTEGTMFYPDDPCTRSMTVSFLWEAAGSPPVSTGISFTDVASDADYAQAVAWAALNGITNGTSFTTFSPDDICTRGQIMTFLYRDRVK